MYIGNDLQVAESGNKIIDDISSSFNGSTTSFALTVGGYAPVPFPINTQQIYISVNGVLQEPDPSGSAGFKLSGSNIVFSSAPSSGQAFFGVILSGADYVTVGTEFPAGSATAPSITFGTDNDTGMYSVTSGQMGFTSNGVQTFTLTGDAFKFNDNKKLICGTGSDLEIYHSGSHSFIKDAGTGKLRILSDDVLIANVADDENIAKFTADAGCELYYNNTERFETTNTGTNTIGIHVDDGATHDGDVTFTGASASVTWDKSVDDLIFADNAKAAFGTSSDLIIYHSGSNSFIDEVGTGNLLIRAAEEVQIKDSDSSEAMGIFKKNGAVELYYDNAKKFETVTGGATITGTCTATAFAGDGSALTGVTSVGGNTGVDFNDNVKARWGTGNDIEIYHDGTNSIIDNNTGELRLQGDLVRLMNSAGSEVYLEGNVDGNVELYYDNAKKLETTSGGVTVTGNAVASSKFRGNDDVKVSLGDGEDLQIYHDGSNSYIQNATNVGTLVTKSDYFHVDENQTSDHMLRCRLGVVELYYDGSKKFETVTSGCKITGALSFTNTGQAISLHDDRKLQIGSGDDCDIFHDGTNTMIDNNTGDLKISSPNLRIRGGVVGLYNEAQTESMLVATADAGVELYFNDVIKARTYADGWEVRGDFWIDNQTNTGRDVWFDESADTFKFYDNVKATFGTGNDLAIYHNETNSVIENHVGTLVVKPEGLMRIQDLSSNEVRADFNNNGSVDLYYDGSKKLETTSDGITMTGNVSFSSGNNGLYLGGTGGGNHLNDYETGTWTPQLGGSGNSFTYHADCGGSYCKTGKWVTLYGTIRLTARSGSSQLTVHNFPFTSGDVSSGDSNNEGGLVTTYIDNSGAGTHGPIGNIGSSLGSVLLYHQLSSGNGSALNADEIDASLRWSFIVQYATT